MTLTARLSCLIVTMLGSITLSAAPATGSTPDPQPVVEDRGPEESAADPKTTVPTLYLVGDSTLRSDAPLRGWASEVAAFLDPAKIRVVNRAIGGRSSKTFLLEGRWQKVLDELQPGDLVVVQFGHNDRLRFDDPAGKGRPSLRGEGDETAEWRKPDGTTETVHTFGWYLRRYGNDARTKGATAVFCSMVPHKDWTRDGKIRRPERDDHVVWTRNAAHATGAAFVDLNEIAAIALEQLGPGPETDRLFGDQRTHSSPEGARFNARCFIAGTKALATNPLAPFLNDAGRAIPPATPAPAAQTAPAPSPR